MNGRPVAYPQRIAIAAGERSGDQLGAALIRALREHLPDVHFEGIAGEAMQSEGCEVLYPLERLSVMGFSEVAGRYVSLMRVRRRLAKCWLTERRPDVFIGIDAPDFNLGLERRLKAHGVRTVHYVSPSVWAWRRYRVRGIRKSIDRMLTLFPFESDFYKAEDIRVDYVGHPMADEIPLEPDQVSARRGLGLAADGPIVALLPGSRGTEVGQLAELMLDTAQWLLSRQPHLHFVVPAANPTLQSAIEALVCKRNLPLTVTAGAAREAMIASDVVLLASGTATLEAMLCKRPMVITYRVSALTYHLMKAMLHVKHVGLPNILAGVEIVPERLQHDAVPSRLGQDVLDWLNRPDEVAKLQTCFATMHETLRCNASHMAASSVLDVLRT